MSTHGGSEASGLVLPAGIEQHTAEPGSKILVPEIARTAAAAKERARQFERRRLALEILPTVLMQAPDENAVGDALKLADRLIEMTGGVV